MANLAGKGTLVTGKSRTYQHPPSSTESDVEYWRLIFKQDWFKQDGI